MESWCGFFSTSKSHKRKQSAGSLGWIIYTKLESGEFLVLTLPSSGFSTQTTNHSGRTPFVSGLVLRISVTNCLKFEVCFSFPKVWEMQLSSPTGQQKCHSKEMGSFDARATNTQTSPSLLSRWSRCRGECLLQNTRGQIFSRSSDFSLPCW